MKNLLFILIALSLFSCKEKIRKELFGDAGYQIPWTTTGHIDSTDCNVFVVNDSLLIKSINIWDGGQYYAVFLKGIEISEIYTFRGAFKSDKEMIYYLQYEYIKYDIEQKTYNREGCLNIN